MTQASRLAPTSAGALGATRSVRSPRYVTCPGPAPRIGRTRRRAVTSTSHQRVVSRSAQKSRNRRRLLDHVLRRVPRRCTAAAHGRPARPARATTSRPARTHETSAGDSQPRSAPLAVGAPPASIATPTARPGAWHLTAHIPPPPASPQWPAAPLANRPAPGRRPPAAGNPVPTPSAASGSASPAPPSAGREPAQSSAARSPPPSVADPTQRCAPRV